jgi:FkbM family methyltransferase
MQVHQDILDKVFYPNIKPQDKVIDTSKISDNIIDNLDLDRCDYLIINTGFGFYGVAGARQTIRKFKPKILAVTNREHDTPDLIQFLHQIDLDYDFIVIMDHYHKNGTLYTYAWINHGKRISPRSPITRTIDQKVVGSLTDDEIRRRDLIRARQIPASSGPDPDVYTIKFMPNRTVKYRRSKLDSWNSWYEFQSEVDVRKKFWYNNIKPGDNIVDAGAGWGSYAITAGLLGATAWAYEPHPTYIMDMAENVRLNGLTGKIHMFEAGLSDTQHYTDWDELRNVHMIALDDHLKSPVNYIKIDVEGQELQVLKGARQTIAQYKPKILLEAHLIYNKKMIPDATEYITKLADGYQANIFDCIPSGDTVYVYYYHK